MSDDSFDTELTRRYAQQEQKVGHPQAEEALSALEEACDEIERLRGALREILNQEPVGSPKSEGHELRSILLKNYETAKSALEDE